MMFSPSLLLKMRGEIDVSFDDWDMVKDHPLAAQAMLNFSKLFEMVLSKDVTSVLNQTIETSNDNQSEDYMEVKSLIDWRNDILSMIRSMPTNSHIQTKISIPDLCLSANINFTAPGLS